MSNNELTIYDLFKDYDNQKVSSEELDWGSPQGNEKW